MNKAALQQQDFPRTGELGISLGSNAHEGENLAARLRWACETFDTCVLTVSDTLYRHNLMENVPEIQAWNQSLQMGDEWLQRNHHILNAAPQDKLVIKRWDDWLNHVDYETIRSDLNDFFMHDNGFQSAITQDSMAFANRRIKNKQPPAPIEHSRNFLLEEVACYILIGREHRSLRIYPSRDMACFEYMRGSFIPSALKGLELSPHFDFRAVRPTSTKIAA